MEDIGPLMNSSHKRLTSAEKSRFHEAHEAFALQLGQLGKRVNSPSWEWLTDLVKICVNMAQALYVASMRSVGIIDFPVPLNSLMRKTSGRSVRDYFISGINSYMPIVTMALHRK